MTRVGGLILCGGESRRMGRPKAWLPFGEELLLPRIVRLLEGVVAPVVVVAAPGQVLPSLSSDLRIVRDAEQGRGPLQGLAAGLAALDGAVDAVFASSCDVPFLKPELVRRMIELLADYEIAVPHVGGYHHALAATYRLTVRPTVERLLQQNRLRPFFLFETHRTRLVSAAELLDVDPALDTLRNVNTPEEYAAALADLARGSAAPSPGEFRHPIS